MSHNPNSEEKANCPLVMSYPHHITKPQDGSSLGLPSNPQEPLLTSHHNRPAGDCGSTFSSSQPIQQQPYADDSTSSTRQQINDKASASNQGHNQNHKESLAASTLSAPNQTCVLDSKFKQHYATWLLAFFAASSLAISTWIIYVTFISRKQVPSYLRLSQGHTVILVNVLTHVVAYLVWQLVDSAFEALRWAIASRTTGIPVMSFLAMSRATGLLGVLDLLRVPGWHIIWCVQRCIHSHHTCPLYLS
jgi:hypothetical protein